MNSTRPPNFAYLQQHIGAPNRTIDGYLTINVGILLQGYLTIKGILVYVHNSSFDEWTFYGVFYTGEFEGTPRQITIHNEDTGKRIHMSNGDVEFNLLDTDRIDWISPRGLMYVLRVYR